MISNSTRARGNLPFWTGQQSRTRSEPPISPPRRAGIGCQSILENDRHENMSASGPSSPPFAFSSLHFLWR